MRKSVIWRSRPLDETACRFDAEIIRRPVPDLDTLQPTSPLQGSERTSFEHLIGLLKSAEPCQDIIDHIDAMAFLRVSDVVRFTPVLLRVCARFGEEAGPVAEMLALLYSGLSEMGPDGKDFFLDLHSVAGDRALFVMYLFLKRWQESYYEFDNYVDIGRRLLEMRGRLKAADRCASRGIPARSI